jgi:predicted DNA-binding transcriptional regulator YafY
MSTPKPFATGNRKQSTNEASEAVLRKITMLVTLFRSKRLSLESYQERYNRDRRSFQRDLQQLRKIGEQSGFAISPLKDGAYVDLEYFDAKIRVLHKKATETERFIGKVARAMGQPVAAEMGQLGTASDTDDGFLHFAIPTVIEDENSIIASISAELKAAWAARALVTFTYPDRTAPGGFRERLVEPYRVLLRSGVFYLVAYDRGRQDWRTFALDRFRSTPKRAGTNNAVREIPEAYASNDVLGFIKSDQPRTDVTVELSPFVAASAISRRWQTAQRSELLEDGRARITFSVSDLNEIARWAFGFGKDAKIIAPPQAIRVASEMARAIAAQHDAGDATTDGIGQSGSV